MTKTVKRKLADWSATVIGALVAIANAWITIDWENFELNEKNCFKLALSGIIAFGGYLSRFKTKENSAPTNQTPNIEN
jgi:hypothetical protein